jgi:hypothetical protein
MKSRCLLVALVSLGLCLAVGQGAGATCQMANGIPNNDCIQGYVNPTPPGYGLPSNPNPGQRSATPPPQSYAPPGTSGCTRRPNGGFACKFD